MISAGHEHPDVHRRWRRPVAANVSDRLVRLPLFHSLTDPEQSRVIEAVRELQP